MANFLTIKKETNDYFTFVLNGDSANEIKNKRNDLLMSGDYAHIKSANGANIIKQQNIIYSNITIVDGVTSEVPVSRDDLFIKLIGIGYFDWMDSVTGGVNRFDDLLDTFKYFGKDGQILRVNESELKLETFELPDLSYLGYFPSPLQPLKSIRVKQDGLGYEFFEPVNIVTQTIIEGNTTTAPSEDVVYKALQNIQNQIAPIEPQSFPALSTGTNQTFTITGGHIPKTVYRSKGLLYKNIDWSFISPTLTIITNTNTGNTIYVEF